MKASSYLKTQQGKVFTAYQQWCKDTPGFMATRSAASFVAGYNAALAALKKGK